MNKKQNFEKNLHVNFTRSFIHVIRNEFNQKNNHIFEKVLFVVVNDNFNEYTKNYIQSKFEIEKHTILRNNQSYCDTNFQQNFKTRRHYQQNIEMNQRHYNISFTTHI